MTNSSPDSARVRTFSAGLPGWFTGSRLVIAAIGLAGAATFVDQHTLAVAGRSALDPELVWHKWDARWYERIALTGYQAEAGDASSQATAGFFPLYPLAIGLMLQILPALSFFWTATVVSNVLALAALALAGRFLTANAAEATRLAMLTLTAAGSFYLSIPYAESLFLLLIVLVLILTRREDYLLAALVAGLAVVTRPHGVALIAVPGVACLLDRKLPWGQRAVRLTLMAAVALLPLAIYMHHLSNVQGSAAAFVERQAMWDNAVPYPFKAIAGFVVFPGRLSGWVHGAFWFLYVGLLIRYWRQLSPGEALFCAGALLISTQQESFHGIYRYTIPLVPLTLALGRDRPDIRFAVIAINLVFGAIMILAYVTNNRLTV